jgi:hypothetical protein
LNGLKLNGVGKFREKFAMLVFLCLLIIVVFSFLQEKIGKEILRAKKTMKKFCKKDF